MNTGRCGNRFSRFEQSSTCFFGVSGWDDAQFYDFSAWWVGIWRGSMWEGMRHGDFAGRGCVLYILLNRDLVSIGTPMFFEFEDVLVSPVIPMSRN